MSILVPEKSNSPEGKNTNSKTTIIIPENDINSLNAKLGDIKRREVRPHQHIENNKNLKDFKASDPDMLFFYTPMLDADNSSDGGNEQQSENSSTSLDSVDSISDSDFIEGSLIPLSESKTDQKSDNVSLPNKSPKARRTRISLVNQDFASIIDDRVFQLGDQHYMVLSGDLNSGPARNLSSERFVSLGKKARKSIARVDERSTMMLINYDYLDEKELPPISQCLLKTFPKFPKKILGFASTGKTAVFLFETPHYISTFYSNGLGEEYKTTNFDIAPKSRSNCSIFALDENKIAILGGNGVSNGVDFWVLNIKKNIKWKEICVLGSVFPIMTLHSSVCVKVNQKYYIYTFGGKRCNEYSSKILLLIYSGGDCCTYREFVPYGNSPPVRTHHTLTRCGNKIFLFGGLSENLSLMGDLWELDISINGPLNPIWKCRLTSTGPPPRYSHNAFYRDGYLFIAGGFNVDGAQLNDIWRYDGESWSLYGCFDDSKYVFSSDQGLVLFNNIFELVEEKAPVYTLSAKYEILIKRRDEFDQKQYDYMQKLRSEHLKMGQVEALNSQIQGDSPTKLYDECDRLFKSEKDISKYKREFVTEANKTFSIYMDKFGQAPSPPHKYIIDLLDQLQTKYNSLKNDYQHKKKEKDDELKLCKKQAKVLEELNGEIKPIKIDPSDAQTIDVIMNRLDSNHQTLFLPYYYALQQRTYESNEQLINELTKKIENCRKKNLLHNREIYEAMKQITQIKSDCKKVENKINELNIKMENIKKILRTDVDLPGQYDKDPEEFERENKRIIEENSRISDEMKREFEEVAAKKNVIRSVFQEVEELLNYYHNQSTESAVALRYKLPLLKKMMYDITGHKENDFSASKGSDDGY
ncbi:Kelch motif family protein [Histomonas meleagridis]|uniref:Kelch motif family protein n=1 Tax=Histomonas meleagridis TaxID=135588 RepID=UPI00355AA1DA|nr:Kelch motif family protein [Histomonas meleagridis]KAH0802555.1 Kelch motif family protein [Histomonas meleagridis]